MPKKTKPTRIHEDHNFWRALDLVDIHKLDPAFYADFDPEVTASGVRLYCTMSRRSWTLQLRGFFHKANREKGKDFMLANASLDRQTMRELRNALTRQLHAGEEFDDDPDPPTEEDIALAKEILARARKFAKQKKSA